MSYGKMGALNQYSQVSVQADTNCASPHRLIQMLLAGALEKIAVAKGCLVRGEIHPKGQYIGWAMSIITGLRASLDLKTGGEIAQNLNDLYEYMGRRLLHANRNNDTAALDEVITLLHEVKGAWDAIPEHVQQAHADTVAKAGMAAAEPSATAP